jgi:glycosyltransferase involved in cell wall biosynthesis
LPDSADLGGTPLRICLLTEIFHPEDQGGQGQQAFELARRIRGRGIEVIVAARRNFAASTSTDTIEGIEVTRLNPTGLLKGAGWAAVLPTFAFLGRLLIYLVRSRHRYDLVLVQGVKGILIPAIFASRILGKSCVVKVDAVAELEEDLTPESLQRMGLSERSVAVRLWARFRDWLLRQADAVIAISAELGEALARHCGPARVERIPNGIDLRRWPAATGDKRELRRRLGLPDGVLLTYTGRLSRGKGLLPLLQVWQQVAPRHPRARLVLVGSGDRSFDGCEPELRAYVEQNGLGACVTFTGQVENVVDYLRASDLFVLSSRAEGFGLSLAEAMAVGLPCISTAVGIAPELIPSRDSGWLVAVDDAQALRGAIEEALDSPGRWTAIGAAARRAVMSQFDLDQVTTRYVELFRRLVPVGPAALPGS